MPDSELQFNESEERKSRPIVDREKMGRHFKVILRGSVRSWEEWEQADRMARNAPGVYEVINKLDVNP